MTRFYYISLLAAVILVVVSCATSSDDDQNESNEGAFLVCIADGYCNPECQQDYDCTADDDDYNCSDSDGDEHNDYDETDCPQGDDYCPDDPNNWTQAGCESCIDEDGDGYGDNCSRGTDCDDEDETINDDCPVICPDAPCGSLMVSVDAGCFEMGDSKGEMLITNDIPVHTVCLDSYEIDIFETTNAEYRECVEASACPSPSDTETITREEYYGLSVFDDYPVVNVDWYSAGQYCSWAGKRLPTEAEWEYAARGGLSDNYYPWGNDFPTCQMLNYKSSQCIGDTTAVGSYPAYGFGVYDMSGNVEEWVNDRYDEDYYSTLPDPVSNPTGPDTGSERVVRGGSWYDATIPLYVFSRRGNDADWDSMITGFRCAR